MFYKGRQHMICIGHIGGVTMFGLGEEWGLGMKGKQSGRRTLYGIDDECLKPRRWSTHPLQFKKCTLCLEGMSEKRI